LIRVIVDSSNKIRFVINCSAFWHLFNRLLILNSLLCVTHVANVTDEYTVNYMSENYMKDRDNIQMYQIYTCNIEIVNSLNLLFINIQLSN